MSFAPRIDHKDGFNISSGRVIPSSGASKPSHPFNILRDITTMSYSPEQVLFSPWLVRS